MIRGFSDVYRQADQKTGKDMFGTAYSYFL